MDKPIERKLLLVDKDDLIEKIWYAAHIGGEERLLSQTEVIALINEAHVWVERTVVRI